MKAGRVFAAGGLLAMVIGGPAAAAPDAAALARGEQLYGRCVACHAIDRHRVGPAHCGLFGRRAGTARGFADYSPAMRRARMVWRDATLDAFLRNPGATVPGTTMGYAGIPDGAERRDLIAWLKSATRPGVACRIVG